MTTKVLVKVGATNLTPYLKGYTVDYNVLVADTGRNARGNLRLQVINRKAKLNLVFRPMNEEEMSIVLLAIKAFSPLTVEYWDVESQTQKTAQMYPNTASPNMYWNAAENALYQDLSLNLIEL